MTSESRVKRRAVLNGSGLERVNARHPWIFRGNIKECPVCKPGDIIPFTEPSGEIRGWGLWSESALSIRVLSFKRREPDQFKLLRRRAERALELRKRWCPGDEAFRWVHGEADGLPGITADLYGGILVLQLSAFGWYRHAEKVADTFRRVRKLSAVILKNESKHLDKEGIPAEVKTLLGEMPASPVPVKMGELRQYVDFKEGQKTGAYLDSRTLPSEMKELFAGARVLDCFSYQGNVALHALHFGAESCTAIEQSERAAELARKTAELNGLPGKVRWITGNAFDVMRDLDTARERFDLVVMDPPPFSPSRSKVDAAARGYKELALRGLKRLEDGGHLVFLSCSHLFGRGRLLAVLADAACDEGVSCRIIKEIIQPADHPVLLEAPETNYFKGFVMEVERE